MENDFKMMKIKRYIQKKCVWFRESGVNRKLGNLMSLRKIKLRIVGGIEVYYVTNKTKVYRKLYCQIEALREEVGETTY